MIQIMEKPDWVSWDDIQSVLQRAHASNRANGINMRKPSLPGKEIAKEIGDEGKMFVALDGNKVVGTSAIVIKRLNYWCARPHDKYACVYFASVLPEYAGQGIYKRLDLMREQEAKAMGVDKLLGDTHEMNKHRLSIAKRAGYQFVDYVYCRDHFNIVFVKWLNGCPHSRFRVWFEYNRRRHWRRLIIPTKRALRKWWKRNV